MLIFVEEGLKTGEPGENPGENPGESPSEQDEKQRQI